MIRDKDKFDQKRPAGYDGHFDWDFLKPAWGGTKIEPMDIDGMVERNGRFLKFETKNPLAEMPLGQEIALRRLVILGKGKIHLMVLYGKNEKSIEGMEEWFWKAGEDGKPGKFMVTKTPCDADYVVNRCTQWFHWANQFKGEGDL
jgi:hypothetical protein